MHINICKEKKIFQIERIEIIIKSAKQVGRPIFFALVLVVVSFLPIFALTGQEGRLFTPLAFTKSFAMISGAILSITIVPILMVFLIRGKIMAEDKNILNKFFIMLILHF
jgi:Cu(I)/Ag(I) efflux system membrane protein CusA/SilA